MIVRGMGSRDCQIIPLTIIPLTLPFFPTQSFATGALFFTSLSNAVAGACVSLAGWSGGRRHDDMLRFVGLEIVIGTDDL
jgi:hypothetical protein